jgi:hypothetical protein
MYFVSRNRIFWKFQSARQSLSRALRSPSIQRSTAKKRSVHTVCGQE